MKNNSDLGWHIIWLAPVAICFLTIINTIAMVDSWLERKRLDALIEEDLKNNPLSNIWKDKEK